MDMTEVALGVAIEEKQVAGESEKDVVAEVVVVVEVAVVVLRKQKAED